MTSPPGPPPPHNPPPPGPPSAELNVSSIPGGPDLHVHGAVDIPALNTHLEGNLDLWAQHPPAPPPPQAAPPPPATHTTPVHEPVDTSPQAPPPPPAEPPPPPPAEQLAPQPPAPEPPPLPVAPDLGVPDPDQQFSETQVDVHITDLDHSGLHMSDIDIHRIDLVGSDTGLHHTHIQHTEVDLSDPIGDLHSFPDVAPLPDSDTGHDIDPGFSGEHHF